jgi:hypothetical protein
MAQSRRRSGKTRARKAEPGPAHQTRRARPAAGAASGTNQAPAATRPTMRRTVGGPAAPRWLPGAVPRIREAILAGVTDAADTNLTVVYVHGIGNKPAPEVLKRQWDQALFGIDMGSRTRLAYWADIRYPQPLPATQEDMPALSPEAYHPGALDRLALLDPALLVPYGRDAEEYARRVADRLLPTGQAYGPRAADVEEKVLPGFLRRPVVEWLTKTFIQDTAAYFFNPEQRDEMRNRLRQILLAQNGPFLVIAHSQGSMIAYDVLRVLDDGEARFDVPLLVTIGSPLGLDEVQDHLVSPLGVPKVVKTWSNFADLLDPVALDKTLAGEFPGTVKIDDETVVNRDTLRLAGFNPHSGAIWPRPRFARRCVTRSGVSSCRRWPPSSSRVTSRRRWPTPRAASASSSRLRTTTSPVSFPRA